MQPRPLNLQLQNDPVLAAISGQLCGAGRCRPAVPCRPVCTGRAREKLERCILELQRKVDRGEAYYGQASPYAICTAAAGCRRRGPAAESEKR